MSDAPTTAFGASTARTGAGAGVCTGVVWLGVGTCTLGTCTGEAGVTPSFCRPDGTGLRVILANAGTGLLAAADPPPVLIKLSLFSLFR